eukprot:CAMPEP_0197880226 /NCGR_PEP_ID=MMETSP1439-20131203/8104_1 /TAXON_ID=66791 /ORGANISM="Gonyaulax spinifera, Strain CCMP409" /LENGTH=36 /DNA_ID= /DNA_START= /DNA_END= /DNA_ORIENTATION=
MPAMLKATATALVLSAILCATVDTVAFLAEPLGLSR